MLKTAKNNHEKEIINNYGVKETWKYVNKQLNRVNKKEKNNHSVDYLITDNKKIANNNEIKNCFNNYFSTIGYDLANKINKPNNNIYIEPPKNNKNTMFLSPTNCFEIRKIINTLKNKNGGVDNINAKSLKNMIDYITEPITHLINLSIEKSVYPKHFKISEIVPIYKSSDKHNPSNYRSISLVSNLSKIYERLLYNRLDNFIY